MAFVSLLSIVLKRMWSRKGLSALLLLSTSLTIAILAGIPIFAGAVGQRLIQEELGMTGAALARSPYSVLFYARGTARRPLSIAEADQHRLWLGDLLARHLGLPAESSTLLISSPRRFLLALEDDPRYTERLLANNSLVTADNIGDKITVIEGDPFGEPVRDGALNVWAVSDLAEQRALQVGDRLEYGEQYGDPKLPVRIAGFWEPTDLTDPFWDADPSWHYDHRLLVVREGFEAYVSTAFPAQTDFVFFHFVLEDARVNLDRAPFYIERLAEITREVAARLPGGAMEQDLAYYLNRGQERKAALSLVLLGLMMPLVAIIMVFISAVSTMLARMQAQEVAMLMSRGMRRIQVLGLTLVEVLLLLAAALPLGLGLSLILARLLGYSASFMRFVPRVPLAVSLASLDGRYLLGAVGVTLVSRLALSWGASRRSIVAQERENARSSPVLEATRLLLMGVLVAATYYSYFRLIQIGSLSVVGFQPGEEGYDPLLLLSPSLFMLVGPMLLSELFVWLLRPLAWISPLARGVASYLGLMDLGREGGQYRMSVYMLALCLGFGVYCASLARSADTWILDRRRYEMGADVVLRPESLAEMARRYNMPIDQARQELETAALLPVSDYEAVPGVAAASQVGEYEASVRLGGRLEAVQMLAVDRYRFGSTAYWRDDYAHAGLGGGTESLGALMNRLGVASNGMLMQADLAERYGLALGDTLEVSLVLDPESTAPLRTSMTFELAGLLDYFPTALEPARRPVVVADLNDMQLQAAGSLPFAVWLRLAPGVDAAEFLRALPLGLRLAPEYMFNLQELVEKDAGRMERVGIFGALSISFLAGALLSALGLLVHTAAAQRRRALRFAVLQVLGMDRLTLAGTMLLEYGVTLGYSVLTGIGLGIAASELYVPLVHLSGSRGVPIPPYVPIIDRPMAAVLGGVMALTLLGIEVGLIVALMRSRVFETLRMGTRE